MVTRGCEAWVPPLSNPISGGQGTGARRAKDYLPKATSLVSERVWILFFHKILPTGSLVRVRGVLAEQ
ncbi:hypothetical protein AV530_016627 [Patagioenas fasciata monilis]|uniref:Uncharacterized protein n=1 Tax=Patagioenas fasciata monilis TaxID=372326 RepID=A0A1V4J2Y5_PATFA|nr:hypothetical protein AV530_016627 [Patagioenas fasciata monilis]